MAIAKSVKFNFNSRKITDEQGKEIGRTRKQDAVTCDIPVPAADEIVSILQNGGKEADLVYEAVAEIIVSQAREQFDELIESFGSDESKVISASMLDYDKLNLVYIASIPPARRGASAITDEDWKVFFDDYLAVMVAATGKAEERIKNHINLFKSPAKAKANKEVLAVLVDQLDIYMSSSANLDDTGTCAVRISEKFKKWIAEPEKALNMDLL
jgi:hypothetical protein